MYPKQQNEFTTVKKRTMTQAQFTKGNLAVEGSKDKLITNLPLTNGKIVLISGKPAKDTIVPTDEHPFDHFMVMATMGRSLPR